MMMTPRAIISFSAVLLALQTGILGWVITVERRLARIETVIELRVTQPRAYPQPPSNVKGPHHGQT